MLKNFLKDTLSLVIGSTVFGIGLCVFALPNSLLTGGAGGLATILHSLTGLGVGTGVLIINIPLFIAALRICGRGYSVRVLYSTAVFSVVLDICEIIKLTYTKNLAIAALCCGIFTGVGMYILLRRSLVTGGSDLLAYLINKKHPKKTLGSLIFIIDGAVIISGAFIYKSARVIIYSILLIAVMSGVLTLLLEKKINAKLFKRNNRS